MVHFDLREATLVAALDQTNVNFPANPISRRTLIRGTLATALLAGVPLSLLDTHRVELKHVPLTLGLSRPLRMVALGDLHFDPLCEEDYVSHVCDMVNKLNPDIIVYIGDLMTEDATRCEDMARLLSRSVARLGSFAALGNHEHLSGAGRITAALEGNGIRVLCNECVPLPSQENFYLTGLDSFWGSPDLGIFSRTPQHSRHILLAHEPDPFLKLNDPRIALQISGHTHGGQIRIPFYGAWHLPIRGKKFDQGLFAKDGRYLYVNRGIGTLKPHVRFDCRPEITVFELS